MNLDQLIGLIYQKGAAGIVVKKSQVRKGNRNGQGNYDIVLLTIGSEHLEFSNETGVWDYCP